MQPGVDYLPAMREECKRFIDLLRKVHGPEPEGARLRIKRNPHDFGPYLDVVCEFDEAFPESLEYALKLEGNLPETWDALAPSDGEIQRREGFAAGLYDK